MALRPLDSVEGSLASEQVGFGSTNSTSALEHLPEDVEEEVNGDSDVIGDEVLVAEAAGPDIEAVEEDDDREEHQRDPGEVRLEGGLEDEGVAVNTLGLESSVEANVRNADGNPGEEGGNGGQVLEPGEDGVGAGRAGHVGEETDRGGDGNAPVGDTSLGTPEEEARSLTVLGQSVQVTGTSVQEGVGGGGSGGQDDGVNDRGKSRDTSALNGDDPRRGGSTGSTAVDGAEKTLVVVRDQDTDGERTEDVEEENTPEDTLDGLGDVATGISGLTSSDGNHLNTAVRESSVDEGGEETKEATSAAGGDVLGHGTRVLPVVEAKTTLGRTSAKVNAECHDQETDNGDDLDRGEQEFGFTIDGDGEDIQAHNEHKDNGDPGSDVDVDSTGPVLDNDRRGGDFSAESDSARIPVVPADGETHGIIDVTGTELRNGTGKRQPCGHLTERHHHGVNSETSEGVAQKDGQRTSGAEGTADTDEQASTDGTTEGDELDVTGLQSVARKDWSVPIILRIVISARV